ncbi:MAG: 23S rRNA (guanosine(2251)-2'-O)-methyltransferase RlmB [Elusimicrobiota bacterium]|jgi:23S rRNA (guanosine2251-2'-O)-methyltransferase|nr:23S rRNA (guanosine(2251)-2'-O)-methyltransferase RlmB [Elusimicrobiota bacterium]
MKNKINEMNETNESSIGVVYGRNPVLELLKSDKRTINKITISKTAVGSVISEILKLARDRAIAIHYVPSQKLDKISPYSQGIAAEVSAMEYIEIDSLIKMSKENPKPLIVLLDCISDPRNLGAIIRNCAAFGADGIIIPKWRASGVNETASKTSAGAIEYVSISRVSNLNNAIDLLKKEGFWIAGAETGGQNLTTLDLPFPLAVIIGSEGEGLRKIVKENCDYIISIPQKNEISSLNASCAAAIILYEISKHR